MLLAWLQLLNVVLLQTKKLFPAGLFAVVRWEVLLWSIRVWCILSFIGFIIQPSVRVFFIAVLPCCVSIRTWCSLEETHLQRNLNHLLLLLLHTEETSHRLDSRMQIFSFGGSCAFDSWCNFILLTFEATTLTCSFQCRNWKFCLLVGICYARLQS